jgi:hypothetical protein
VRKERDDLRVENLELKKENDRLNYRVQHLIKSLNAEESRSAKIIDCLPNELKLKLRHLIEEE